MRLALSFPFLPLPFAGRTKGNALFSATDSSQRNSEGGTFSPSSASVPRRAEDDRRDGRYATPAARMKNDERAAYRIVSYRISFPLLSLLAQSHSKRGAPRSEFRPIDPATAKTYRRGESFVSLSSPDQCRTFRPKVTITGGRNDRSPIIARGTRPFVTRSGCLVPP